MVIHETQKATVEWINDGRIVRKSFKGNIVGKELKKAFNVGLKTFRKYNANKWLSDNRGVSVYSDEDIRWINSVWLPQMVESGWRFWAIVEGRNGLDEKMISSLQSNFNNNGIQLQVFKNMNDAVR